MTAFPGRLAGETRPRHLERTYPAVPYIRTVICAFIRSRELGGGGLKGPEDKGTKQPTVGTLGPRRNSPSAPSNEPHTSPVPGYEAVEATGVATVGAIEPVCLPHNVRRREHQTREGGRGEGGPRCSTRAGPFGAPRQSRTG